MGIGEQSVDGRASESLSASVVRRAGFGAALVLAMAAGTFTQFAVGVLGPLIREDLQLSRTGLGMLTTTLFVIAGAASPVVGPLVDALGGRRVALALFAVAGAALGGMALAPGYPWLVAAVAVAGLAMAATNPVTNQLVSAHIAPGRRGLLMGVKQSGVQMSAFAAGALLPSAATALGWRGALAASVGLALAGAAVTILLVPADRPRRTVAAGGRARERLPGAVWWLCGYAFLMGAGVAAVSAHLPLYAYERLGFSVTAAGAVAATIGLAGVFARIAWGYGAERIGSAALPLAGLASCAAAAQALLWAAETAGAWLLWAGAAAFGASAVAWNAVGMLTIVRLVHLSVAGRASGIVLLGFYAGFVVSPVAFGFAVDATGSYGLGWAGVTATFAAAAVLASGWHHASRPRRPAPGQPVGSGA